MEYQDLIHEYKLNHSPGNYTEYDSLRELIIQNNFKLLVVSRATWGKSFAIVDTAWFPSPSEQFPCKIWANVFFQYGTQHAHTARLCLDNPYKKGQYELLFVSDINMILNYSRR